VNGVNYVYNKCSHILNKGFYILHVFVIWSQNGAFGRVTTRLNGQTRNCVAAPCTSKRLLYSPKACSPTTKANQSPIQLVPVVTFPWVKWRLCEADHPPSSSDEFKNEWSNRYRLPGADFHETQNFLTSLFYDSLCRISSQQGNKCGK
jgi:hypothetical protein